MRRRHFEALRPVCPRCRLADGVASPVELVAVLREADGDIAEGVLACTRPVCRLEFPIIDGAPILVPDVRGFVSQALLPLLARDDLSATMEGLIGDCAGPGSVFDLMRQHAGLYAWDHYGDLDPQEPTTGENAAAPGGARACLAAGLALLDGSADGLPAGPAIDLGCATGRLSFDLAARTDDLVLGIDLNVAMIRLARRVLTDGQVAYPRRRVGVVYDRRCFDACLDAADRVDFWLADVLALPFAEPAFGLATAVNLIDCVGSPAALPAVVANLLRPGGAAVIATPYDWSSAATPVEGWIGGHSQRGPQHGASEPLMRALLTPGAHPQSVEGLRLVGEHPGVPWHLRLHDRATMAYAVHVLATRK